MPLYRHTKLSPHTKLPPPPELGEKTVWQYLPKRTGRRVLFLLLAFGAVLFLKSSGSWSFGGLLDGRPAPAPAASADAPVFHLRVARPASPPAPPSAP